MTYAQRIIREEAAKLGLVGINAAGIEGSMRLLYGTLGHLSRTDFRHEIEIANDCEQHQPGFLASVARSYGL